MPSPQPSPPARVCLPPEIWWLVCKGLARSVPPDFDALFNLALVSRNMSTLALPTLYSVHSQASASASDASLAGQRRWALLWRSLILSSIAKTAFPYALWIRKLELGNLVLLLEEGSPATRAAFFHGDMSPFQIEAARGAARATRSSQRRRPLDLQAICLEVGERITAFAHDAAVRDGKVVTLASLEGHHIPGDVLPTWLSRLSNLRSLTLRDGSVLSAHVAQAISRSCPAFVELCCFNCLGDEVDAQMAAFFLALPPDSLQYFRVFSSHGLARQAFAALGHHGRSLNTLDLCCLDASAVTSLDALAECTALEALALEGTHHQQTSWERQHNQSFRSVASWLRRCGSLRSITIKLLPDASLLMAEALSGESLRLRNLELKLSESRGCGDLFAAIGHQSRLLSLWLSTDDETYDHRNDRKLAKTICSSCHDLVVLDLVDTRFDCDGLRELGERLSALEAVSFDSKLQADGSLEEDVWDDDVWKALWPLSRLKMVQVNGPSSFSPDRVCDFVAALAKDNRRGAAGRGGSHSNFILHINSQTGMRRFSTEWEDAIAGILQRELSGEFSIGYDHDPDEEHESDFSE